MLSSDEQVCRDFSLSSFYIKRKNQLSSGHFQCPTINYSFMITFSFPFNEERMIDRHESRSIVRAIIARFQTRSRRLTVFRP